MLHIAPKNNFADVLTKHWRLQGAFYELTQPLFHHEDNTVSLFLDDTFAVDASFEDDCKMMFGILESVRVLC